MQIRPEHLDPIALQRDIILTAGILHLILDIGGTQRLLEFGNPPRVVHGLLLSLLPGLPSTASRSPREIPALPIREAILHLLLLNTQHGSDISNAGSLLVHQRARTVLLLHQPADFALVLFVEVLGLFRDARPALVKEGFGNGDHLAGRGELALHGEFAEEVVGAEAEFGVVEVHRVVGNPHVFAEAGGDGFLAVVE